MTMEEFVSRPDVQEAIRNAESYEEIIKLFADNGFEVTEEQLEASFSNQSGELNEDALDEVAGGLRIILPLLPLPFPRGWPWNKRRKW